MVSQTWLDSAADLAAWLRHNNWHMVTAESCTGGGIGYAMSALAGSSDCFSGGFITYSNALKQQLLGVPEETLDSCGAVSAETAAAMAQGACRVSGAEVAVAVTGVAGPSGGSASKPVGLVWFGLAWPGGVMTWHQQFSGDRAAVREATIVEALQSFKKKLDTV